MLESEVKREPLTSFTHHRLEPMSDHTSMNPPLAPNPSLDWPQDPCGIIIMGKRQGTKKGNKQLQGRVALAAALWYSAPQPKPYLIYVASDIQQATNTPDAETVKLLLIKKFGIPGDYVIARQKTNCTLLEVRAARVIKRAYNLARIFAVTHLYHAPRSQRYFDEVLPNTSVIAVQLAILDEITFPLEALDTLAEIKRDVKASMPGFMDRLREQCVEWLLGASHLLDRRGRLERMLASLLRS